MEVSVKKYEKRSQEFKVCGCPLAWHKKLRHC
jgi:hypothetical protein